MPLTTEYKRLAQYMFDYFPDTQYNTKDIVDWAKENVPAWDVIPSSEKKAVLNDWEDFIQPKVEKKLKGFSKRFVGRIRRFLKRLF